MSWRHNIPGSYFTYGTSTVNAGIFYYLSFLCFTFDGCVMMTSWHAGRRKSWNRYVHVQLPVEGTSHRTNQAVVVHGVEFSVEVFNERFAVRHRCAPDFPVARNPSSIGSVMTEFSESRPLLTLAHNRFKTAVIPLQGRGINAVPLYLYRYQY